MVLVVEDDEMLRELNRLNLEHRGFEVVEADCGESAIEHAQQRRPDLILLDLSMPGMDGWTTLDHLRKIDGVADVPVVMLTALAGEANEEKARLLDVFAFVGKPVLVDDLERVMRRALEGGRS